MTFVGKCHFINKLNIFDHVAVMHDFFHGFVAFLQVAAGTNEQQSCSV